MTPSCASAAASAFSAETSFAAALSAAFTALSSCILGGDALCLERAGARQRLVGLADGDLRVADAGAHLGDVGLRLRPARLCPGKLGVEHGAVEHRQHLALADPVADVGVEAVTLSPFRSAPAAASSRATMVPLTDRVSTSWRRSAGTTRITGRVSASGGRRGRRRWRAAWTPP